MTVDLFELGGVELERIHCISTSLSLSLGVVAVYSSVIPVGHSDKITYDIGSRLDQEIPGTTKMR